MARYWGKNALSKTALAFDYSFIVFAYREIIPGFPIYVHKTYSRQPHSQVSLLTLPVTPSRYPQPQASEEYVFS